MGLVFVTSSPISVFAQSALSWPLPTSGAERLAAWKIHQRLEDQSRFRELEWRPIGPAQAGARIEAIAVHPDRPSTIYVGVGSGNLWKSTNNGLTFNPIFDHESTFAVGDVAIAPSNPEVVWIGTGETQPRHSGFAYAGTGVFRSINGGTTWEHKGLADSHHIAKVLVHPTDPNIAYVAALGRFFRPNEERGLFKTTDGGTSWTKVLYISDGTGVVDAAFDPRDPEILYAAAWQAVSGTDLEAGPESGLYKSTDGGSTWQHLTAGLPNGPIGRMGIDVSLSNPDRVYVFMDDHSKWQAPAGKSWETLRNNDKKAPFPTTTERTIVGASLYVSENAGQTWAVANQEDLFGVFGIYGWKFCDVRVSPSDPNELFLLGLRAFHSTDGGKSFVIIGEDIRRINDTRGQGMHLDHHEIWLDPNNSGRVLLGNDGGLFQSWDRGQSWLHHNNIPAAEFYSVSIWDPEPERTARPAKDAPYTVLGGTQDNAALYGPSDATLNGHLSDRWENVYLDPWTGGDSFGTYVDPTDPTSVYYEHQHGDLLRMNIAPGGDVLSGGASSTQIRPEKPQLDDDRSQVPWRFGWDTPYLLSFSDPKTLFLGADQVLLSTNRGESWQAISPVLADEAEGPRAPVPFGVISALAQSHVQPALLLAGTEGGSLYLGDMRLEDPGSRWQKVDTPDLPDLWITTAVLSQHREETLYVAMSGYRYENHSAYLFASEDGGEHWRPISANLPAASIHVLLEDPEDRNLLYIGTDLGVYASLNRGESWIALSSTLPTTPVHDLEFNERTQELIAGTHGRSVWIASVEAVRTALLFEGKVNL